MSPTQRTLKLLRGAGYVPAVVEKWIQARQIRMDAWGLIDIVAVQARRRVLFLQVTSWGSVRDHLLKMTDPAAAANLGALTGAFGSTVELWGWRKAKPGLPDLKRIRFFLDEDSGLVVPGPPQLQQSKLIR